VPEEETQSEYLMINPKALLLTYISVEGQALATIALRAEWTVLLTKRGMDVANSLLSAKLRPWSKIMIFLSTFSRDCGRVEKRKHFNVFA
jgi:hypothetical protein